MRVVVLGGRGEFGARVVRMLSGCVDVVAPTRADLDVASRDVAERLAPLRPDVVVNCAGPFQSRESARST